MNKHIMLDIEADGVGIYDMPQFGIEKCNILQIGMVEVDFDGEYWYPGKAWEKLFYHAVPDKLNEFQLKHQRELFELCSKQPPGIDFPGRVRKSILEFFSVCGLTSPHIYFMGWNASTFDVPALHVNGYLNPPHYDETGVNVIGDHHYRVYDLSGSIMLMADILGRQRAQMREEAENIGREITPNLTDGRKQHDALWDCYNQIAILNGLIHIGRKDEC
jgi:hypothetical protein